jgi:hypothetical protein
MSLRLRCGKRGEAVESVGSREAESRSKPLQWNSFGPGDIEWNPNAAKEARSGKLCTVGINVPRGTNALWEIEALS